MGSMAHKGSNRRNSRVGRFGRLRDRVVLRYRKIRTENKAFSHVLSLAGEHALFTQTSHSARTELLVISAYPVRVVRNGTDKHGCLLTCHAGDGRGTRPDLQGGVRADSGLLAPSASTQEDCGGGTREEGVAHRLQKQAAQREMTPSETHGCVLAATGWPHDTGVLYRRHFLNGWKCMVAKSSRGTPAIVGAPGSGLGAPVSGATGSPRQRGAGRCGWMRLAPLGSRGAPRSQT